MIFFFIIKFVFTQLLENFNGKDFIISASHSNNMIEKTTLGAGCFWGVQSEFDKLSGVINTFVGYAGGSLENPSYKDVCYGNTGHAEVVQIEFDNQIITYEELLNKFWEIHNPTSINRQGPDVGSQYRSIILCSNKEQLKIACKQKDEMNNKIENGSFIVTEIVHLYKFYKAEDYHQKYLNKQIWNS